MTHLFWGSKTGKEARKEGALRGPVILALSLDQYILVKQAIDSTAEILDRAFLENKRGAFAFRHGMAMHGNRYRFVETNNEECQTDPENVGGEITTGADPVVPATTHATASTTVDTNDENVVDSETPVGNYQPRPPGSARDPRFRGGFRPRFASNNPRPEWSTWSNSGYRGHFRPRGSFRGRQVPYARPERPNRSEEHQNLVLQVQQLNERIKQLKDQDSDYNTQL